MDDAHRRGYLPSPSPTRPANFNPPPGYSTGRELADEDKEFNRDINSVQAAIENIHQRLKTYTILGGVYRGAIDNLHKATKIVQVVSTLLAISVRY
ncbi:unnamed protein product [Rotaria sordida]|uniref:DDE Tnp4 domain-containing protein n=1 Tax=Rotaria sordida TaxID=392033 RepID=A0A819V082_9BILA|nr:unnamed protein product [Rotaria sordida]CAF3632738.1 unnamed protein product [Rotaria sordida]CAF4101487.1 unnamed protein product [Rotaria sordida]CAF4137682.1 unnamed protein product [Rotaria sordida]